MRRALLNAVPFPLYYPSTTPLDALHPTVNPHAPHAYHTLIAPPLSGYSVTGPSGTGFVTSQLIPLSARDTELRSSYYGYKSGTPVSWLVFQASLPPAGYAAYFIMPTGTGEEAPATHISEVTRVTGPADTTLTNGVVSVTIDGTTGYVSHYSNAATGVSNALNQDWMWYRSAEGADDAKEPGNRQQSGAYIFR